MGRSDLTNRIQKVKLRANELFPENKMAATICNGVVAWYEFFESGKPPTLVMYHDYEEIPNDEYIKECLGGFYG